MAGLEVIKLFSCSIQLSTKFILLINVKMPTIVGHLTFISGMNIMIPKGIITATAKCIASVVVIWHKPYGRHGCYLAVKVVTNIMNAHGRKFEKE